MFAFALWDLPRQRLLLARDRIGEKPLFYHARPDGLTFASELQALRIHPLVPFDVDPLALGQFLAFNYVLDPHCLVAGVLKLAPAHYLLAERGKPLAPVCYWRLADAFRSKRAFASEHEAAEALDAIVADAVRLRLVSDVPLGAFLSGGIDSSAIVSAMTRTGSRSTQTFSIGFDEDSFDEAPMARLAAKALGVNHHEQVVRADAAALPAIVRAADEPMADTSSIPTYYLARFARQSVTVCLSGDGGDENFAGYDTYRADSLHRATRFVPAPAVRAIARLASSWLPVSFDRVSFDFKLRQFLAAHPLDPDRAHLSWRRIMSASEQSRLLTTDARHAVAMHDPLQAGVRCAADVADLDPLDRALYVDIKTWLAGDILVKVDRMTMAHSLESRAPFLDHRVVEFAASLPPSFKLRGRRTKYLLKKSQARRLPAAVIERRKHGFNAPVSQWLAGPLEELGRAATAPAVLGRWFEPGAVERLWTEHRTRARDHGLKLFGLTCFGLWLNNQS